MSDLIIKRALISVYHKDKIVEFASFLEERGVEIICSKGTYKVLQANGIRSILIDEFVEYQNKFGDIIKSLFPFVFASILSKRDTNDKKYGIKPIDMVVVDFYPYDRLVYSDNNIDESIVELIDIGGPALLRAASKNYRNVCPVCSPDFYDEIMEEIITRGAISIVTRKKLAVESFKRTSNYDKIIAETLK